MARITNRQEFIEYCLRRLGYPVHNIEVDPEQVDDRIDDALNYYQEYHYDAVEHVYVPYVITETDIQNQYITIDPDLIRVIQILPIQSGFDTDLRDMLQLNMMDSLRNPFSTTNYTTTASDQTGHYGSFKDNVEYFGMNQELSTLDHMLERTIPIRFSRHTDRIHLDMNWKNINVGTIIVVEGKKIIDPETYPDVYNDWWLKRYATALIKRQWGENLIKFSGLQLTGGLQLDANQIFTSAEEEIRNLEEEIQEKFEISPVFMVG